MHAFQVAFQGNSGLAKDIFVNTWHFDSTPGGLIGADYDNVRDMLKDFYLTSAPVGSELRLSFSGQMNLAVGVKAYRLSDSKPRTPVYVSSFTSSGWAGAAPLPTEVSICFSYEAARVSGEVQRRRRNRIYLPPLATSALGTTGRPTPTLLTNIINRGKELKAASSAAVKWDWVVWSETNQQAYEPMHLWTDDAFDTQRRRGLAPTTRTQFSY